MIIIVSCIVGWLIFGTWYNLREWQYTNKNKNKSKRVIQSMTTKKQQTPSTDRQQKPKVRIYLCNMCREEVIYIPTESVDIGGLVFVRHLEKKHADFYDKLKAQRKASGLAANKGNGTGAIDTGTARQLYFTYKKSRNKTEADDNIELF